MKKTLLYVIAIFIGLAIISIAIMTVMYIYSPYRLRAPTSAEQKFIDSLSKKLQCKVRIDKSVDVVRRNLPHGTLYIQLDFTDRDNDICSKDSSALSPVILPVASSFLKIMDKKNQYDTIIISAEIWDRHIERSETQVCGKNFMFNIKNGLTFTYQEVGKGGVPK